jgi:hypothetical protein
MQSMTNLNRNLNRHGVFFGKGNNQVKKMIGEKDPRICNECIPLYYDSIADESNRNQTPARSALIKSYASLTWSSPSLGHSADRHLS